MGIFGPVLCLMQALMSLLIDIVHFHSISVHFHQVFGGRACSSKETAPQLSNGITPTPQLSKVETIPPCTAPLLPKVSFFFHIYFMRVNVSAF